MIDIHTLSGVYVADALTHPELDDFDAHLDECTQCRDEVDAMRETMADLGALHEVAPPPALRASILGAIAAIPQAPAASQSPAAPAVADAPRLTPPNVITPAHGFGRPRRPITSWLAAAAAVLAVALGGVTVWQQSTLQSIEAADAQRVELLAAPDLEVSRAKLEGGSVTYLVSQGRGQAILTASDLPDPGEDRSWQVWVMQDGVPRSGAVLDTGGRVQAWVDGVAGGEALAITNEPRGGSPAPTTANIQAVFEF